MTKMIEMPATEANNYSLILTLLGMEEEGDPVAEVGRLKALEGSPVLAWQIFGMDGESLFIQQDAASADRYKTAGHLVRQLRAV